LWLAGAVILALAAVGAGGAWLGYQLDARDRENDRRNVAWQQQMKMLAENNSAMERGFTEMAAENARLKARLEGLERRPAAALKAAPSPRSGPAKPPPKPARPPPRKS
jgi:hypothetical protein